MSHNSLSAHMLHHHANHVPVQRTGTCLDPACCAVRAAAAHRYFAQVQANVEALHEGFLSHPRYRIYGSDHATLRMQQREIAFADVVTVIECGYPIDATDRYPQQRHKPFTAFPIHAIQMMRIRCGDARYVLVLLGEAEDGRPLHVVCALGDAPDADHAFPLTVQTVYDPSTEPWRWSDDYRERRCFCPRAGMTSKQIQKPARHQSPQHSSLTPRERTERAGLSAPPERRSVYVC